MQRRKKCIISVSSHQESLLSIGKRTRDVPLEVGTSLSPRVIYLCAILPTTEADVSHRDGFPAVGVCEKSRQKALNYSVAILTLA